MKKSSKSRLTVRQLSEYTGDSLFERIARAVCRAGTLPAKELYEAWEVARRVRRRYRGGRVVDLACGHGLLAHIMLLLDDSSPEALAVDTHLPLNARNAFRSDVGQVAAATWPGSSGGIPPGRAGDNRGRPDRVESRLRHIDRPDYHASHQFQCPVGGLTLLPRSGTLGHRPSRGLARRSLGRGRDARGASSRVRVCGHHTVHPRRNHAQKPAPVGPPQRAGLVLTALTRDIYP